MWRSFSSYNAVLGRKRRSLGQNMMKAFHFLNWNLWVKSKVQAEKQESENGQLRKKPKSAEHNKAAFLTKRRARVYLLKVKHLLVIQMIKKITLLKKMLKSRKSWKRQIKKAIKTKWENEVQLPREISGTFLRKKSRENESSRNLCIFLKGYSSCLKKLNEPIFNVSQEEW